MLTRITTRSLLDAVALSAPEEGLGLGSLLEQFSQRAFGLLLLVSTLPLFVPLPIGTGAIAGPLVMMVGVQLMLLLRRPWLPGVVARHRVRRSSILSFQRRLGPWLDRLERFSRPRGLWIIEHRAAGAFTGVLLLVVGLLAALPIPLTNYPFGVLLALFGVALVEQDGALMATAWVLACATIVATVLLSTEVVVLVSSVFG